MCQICGRATGCHEQLPGVVRLVSGARLFSPLSPVEDEMKRLTQSRFAYLVLSFHRELAYVGACPNRTRRLFLRVSWYLVSLLK